MLQERQWASHLQTPETAARRRRLLGAVVAGQRDGPGRVDAAGAAAAAPSSMGSSSSSVGIICEAAGRFRPITPLLGDHRTPHHRFEIVFNAGLVNVAAECMCLTPGVVKCVKYPWDLAIAEPPQYPRSPREPARGRPPGKKTVWKTESTKIFFFGRTSGFLAIRREANIES